MSRFGSFCHIGREVARIAFNMKIADVVRVQLDNPVSDFATFTNPQSRTEIVDRLLQASNPLAVGL